MSSQLGKEKIRKGRSGEEGTKESRQESRTTGGKSVISSISVGLVLNLATKSVLH